MHEGVSRSHRMTDCHRIEKRNLPTATYSRSSCRLDRIHNAERTFGIWGNGRIRVNTTFALFLEWTIWRIAYISIGAPLDKQIKRMRGRRRKENKSERMQRWYLPIFFGGAIKRRVMLLSAISSGGYPIDRERGRFAEHTWKVENEKWEMKNEKWNIRSVYGEAPVSTIKISTLAASAIAHSFVSSAKRSFPPWNFEIRLKIYDATNLFL